MNAREIKNKVVTHVREHKEIYIASGAFVAGLVVMGTAGAVVLRNSAQNASVTQGIAYKSPVTQHVIQQSIPRAGHAGKVFINRNDPTEIHMSAKKLADALGVTRAMIQDYLSGKIPDLAGRQYDMIADGAPNLMAEMKVKA